MRLTIQKYIAFLFSVFFVHPCFSANETLKATAQKYKKSAQVDMLVEKIVKSELIGSETVYSGKIALSSGGLFRWENSTPEKSLLVFDGQILWNEQSPPPEFSGPVQVVKAKINKKNKTQILVATLLSEGKILESFEVVKEVKNKEEVLYNIKPKTQDINISSLDLKISSKSKEVTEISFRDDVGNLTIMKFSKIEFKLKKNKKLFTYSPPKDAQVSNL